MGPFKKKDKQMVAIISHPPVGILEFASNLATLRSFDMCHKANGSQTVDRDPEICLSLDQLASTHPSVLALCNSWNEHGS